MRLKSLGALAVAAGILFGFNAGAAAQDYPSRQVKIIIAFSPSGAIDILGRFIADADNAGFRAESDQRREEDDRPQSFGELLVGVAKRREGK